jgi:RNA polymerase sigma-70 factor (ECF subfamily)
VEHDAAMLHLARRASGGDRDALESLLRELEPTIVRAVRLVVGSGSWVAEDAAQEALLDVARGIGGLREPAAAYAWALRVATTRALKVARRESLVASRRAAAQADAKLRVVGEDERAAALKTAFDGLPPAQRATAVLRLYVGLSVEETAEILGCSAGTVKSNLHDARRRLTVALTERGLAPQVSPGRKEEDA